MLKISLVALLFLCAAVGACTKNQPAQRATEPPVSRRAVPPPPAPGSSLADAKALLTEDKLIRFARYQTEMVAATADATNAGLAAQPRAGNDPKQVEPAIAGEDRAAKVAAANQAALTKSGLTQDEVSKLSRIVSPYYGRLFAMQSGLSRSPGMRAQAAEAASRGPDDKSMDKLHGEQAARMDAIRKDFGERFGQEGLTLAQKHEPDFFPIHERMLSAALRGMRRAPDGRMDQ